MKISTKSMLALITATTLMLGSGCTHYKRSTISIGKTVVEDGQQKNETIGTLFVWNTDVSAAFIYAEGQTCIQRALTDKNVKASAALSNEILNLSKALATTTDKDKQAALSAAIATTSQLLTTTTERTAFLDTGLFYLCQLGANNTLTKNEVAELSKQLIHSASGLESK